MVDPMNNLSQLISGIVFIFLQIKFTNWRYFFFFFIWFNVYFFKYRASIPYQVWARTLGRKHFHRETTRSLVRWLTRTGKWRPVWRSNCPLPRIPSIWQLIYSKLRNYMEEIFLSCTQHQKYFELIKYCLFYLKSM